MKTFFAALLLGILIMLKLIMTGILLAIGFRIGGEIYDKQKEKMQKASKSEVAV